MAYNRKQRLNDNIKAIETAFILDREQRTPTARERLLLERYCGFGGLKCILNPARELADAVHWAKSDLELFAPTVELHRLIRENSKNESEYKQLMDSLKQSVLTAFYTPSAVTEVLTDVLKEHQIIPEKVLEPSAGIGAFVDSVLDNNPKADIMAFEKDLLTGKILRHLHPEQKVRIEGFEKIEKPFNDYFDLAISNIPFGDVAVFDPSYTAMKGMRALVNHTWPGNVRELKSCIMRAMLLCENEIIDVEDLQLSQSALTEEALDFDEQERKINRERILWALKQCNGIKRDAAKMLEMSHTTFYARMKEYGIPTNKL